jgi:hypothetical protein
MFFCGVEFLIVLSAIFMAIGFIDDLANFLNCSEQRCSSPAWMMVLSGSWCYMCIVLIIRLWLSASSVTAACEDARDQFMDIIMDSLTQSEAAVFESEEDQSSSDMESSFSVSSGKVHVPKRQASRRPSKSTCNAFKKHCEQRITGFTVNGITISYKFVIGLYPLLSTLAVVTLPILKMRLRV